MTKLPAICLTFDLEEFDLPLEYKQSISLEKQMEITTLGVNTLLTILDKHNISCTFFTTANYAQHNISLLKKIAAKHEIASHSFFHSLFHINDLKKTYIIDLFLTLKKHGHADSNHDRRFWRPLFYH